ADIGGASVVSTRVATIQRANRAGLITMQKVFVTDRSTWPRSVKAIEQSDPNLVQLMPAPMLAHLSESGRDDRRHGAVAVSTSDSAWWNFDPSA
ncbi:glycerol-3-phosphate responsive antiterminator, partial [Burkholderia cenocepacia]|nr:glycerol-3-phosphate responsive antiterminator [Burkholderia cenocepacia]